MKKNEPQARYDASHALHYSLKLNRTTDADIISRLDQEQNKQMFIKRAIRLLLEKEG